MSRSGERAPEMRDRLFANQRSLGVTQLLGHARSLGLDEGKFKACVDEGKWTARVREDLAEAGRLGLTATPAFLIGEITSTGRVRVTKRIDGAQPASVFQAALNGLLSSLATPSTK